MVCLMSSLFLSYIFLLVNSTAPRLPRQPRLVARREVPGGRFLEFGQIESETDWVLQYIQETSCIWEFSNGSFDSLKTDSLSASTFLCLVVPSSAVQRIKEERCLRTDAGDLRPALVPANQVSGKCARLTARTLPFACSSSTISSSICARNSL
jgi:hypothetical protein